MGDETPADETARLRAQVEQLTAELAAARVQMRRDAAHMNLCREAQQRAKEVSVSAEMLSNANWRLRKEIANLKQATDPQS